jgi:hypothetical protein
MSPYQFDREYCGPGIIMPGGIDSKRAGCLSMNYNSYNRGEGVVARLRFWGEA